MKDHQVGICYSFWCGKGEISWIILSIVLCFHYIPNLLQGEGLDSSCYQGNKVQVSLQQVFYGICLSLGFPDIVSAQEESSTCSNILNHVLHCRFSSHKGKGAMIEPETVFIRCSFKQFSCCTYYVINQVCHRNIQFQKGPVFYLRKLIFLYCFL